jgi:V-type H+-transporting ATPase subunit H
MANYGEESSELTTANVLKRNIAWDTYLTARLITDHDLQLIRRYDKKNSETQQDLLQEVMHSQE